MTTNLVFDFGAVIFQWQPHRIVGRHFPVHAADDVAARRLAADIFHHEDWQSFDRGNVDAAWVVRQTAERLQLPHQEVQALVAAIPEHLTPMPETVELLQELRARRARDGDLQLYFLSNMPEPFARVLQQRHGFLDCFAGGVFSGDVKMVKPEASIFRMVGERYGLEPSRTVFIDDLPVNVQAARDVGWHGVHFQDVAQLRAALAPHLS